jgi:hypothetical protein
VHGGVGAGTGTGGFCRRIAMTTITWEELVVLEPALARLYAEIKRTRAPRQFSGSRKG